MQATSRLNLSARAYYRILKVALTIADMSGIQKTTGPTHCRGNSVSQDAIGIRSYMPAPDTIEFTLRELPRFVYRIYLKNSVQKR